MARLPALRLPESCCGVPWPTLATETQIHNVCCIICAGEWWQEDLECPFLSEQALLLGSQWQCPSAKQQQGS